MGGQRHIPATLPPGKTQHPLYRRLDGPQDRSGQMRKISPPTGIRPPDRPARSESLYRLSYTGPSMERRYVYVCMYVCMYVRSRIAFSHSPRQAEVNNQLNRRIWPPVTILISHVPDAIKPHRKRLKKTVLTPVSTLQAESCTCNHENKHNTETGRMQTDLCGSQ